MSNENPNPLNNPDGLRRYEQLSADIRKTADEALAIAIAQSTVGRDVVLDIAHGGTGTNFKSFVDTLTNQFEIHGSKIFHDSCGFQKESDVVDSGELAGNVRLIVCDEEAEDIGPQLRFSGRHTLGDPTGFAFATIAGRKSNSISGNKSGYLQFASTTHDGHITEGARLDEEQTFGIGTDIPIKHLGNRLWMSGGDVLLDRVGGQRSYKLGIHDALARIQAVYGFDDQPTFFGHISAGQTDAAISREDPAHLSEHVFFSSNVRFAEDNLCFIDEPTLSPAAVQLKSFRDLPSEIRFWIGEVGACPIIRGVFHDRGLDVAGNVLATGGVTAGGVNNEENGVGNNNAAAPGFVGGDNIHCGTGDPNNQVSAPVGAIYGRRDAPTESLVLYAKVSDDYGPTGWTHIPLAGLNSICVASLCPDPAECAQWYDSVNNMTWFWSPNAKGTGIGAWLSSQMFVVNQKVPVGENAGGVNVAEDFRGRVNKHYVYFTPTNIMKNRRHPQQKFDLYLQDLTTVFRIRNNGLDPVKNYYLFDIVTLMTRQGEPLGGVAKQEWPGDRAADDFTGDIDGDQGGSSDVTGFGHTFYPNLPSRLLIRTLPASGGIASWTGTIATVTNTKKIIVDPVSVVCYDSNGSPAGCDTPSWAQHQFQQNLHRDTPNKPFNPGYVIQITSGAAVGSVVMILDNNGTDSTSPSINFRKPIVGLNPGDTFAVYSRDYKRVITRVSTKGQSYFPNGPYTNAKTKDIQDFVETSAPTTAFNPMNPAFTGNPANPYDAYPNGAADHNIPIDFYIPLVDGGDGITPVDAVLLCGLWNAIGLPGKIAGSVSLTYRLALPNSGGNCANP